MVKSTTNKETKKPVTKKVIDKKLVNKKQINKASVKKVVQKKSVKKSNTKATKFTIDFTFIKNTFTDVFILFRNFIHWNLSKLVIFIWSVILWLLLSFPFLLLYKLLWDLSFIDIYVNLFSWISINSIEPFLFNIMYLYESLWYVVLLLLNLDLLNLLYLTWWILFLLSFLYSNFLFLRLGLSYLNWDKINIKKNDYFNYKKILKFFNLTFINMFILLLPVVIFSVLTWIFALFTGNLIELNELVSTWIINYFSVITFILLILCILLLIYMFYRIIFSYFILSDDNFYKDGKSSFSYVKDSLNITKWLKRFLKFSSIFLIFYIILSIVKYVSFLVITGWDITNTFIIIFSIIHFIVLSTVFLMVFTSFYKRELK